MTRLSVHTIALLMIAASGGGILAGAAGYRSGYRDGIARAHRDALRWARR